MKRMITAAESEGRGRTLKSALAFMIFIKAHKKVCYMTAIHQTASGDYEAVTIANYHNIL